MTQLSDEVVERVAKAIYGDNELWRSGSEAHRKRMRATARAAIAAYEAKGDIPVDEG